MQFKCLNFFVQLFVLRLKVQTLAEMAKVLPAPLLKLFAPRPIVDPLPPLDPDFSKRKGPFITPVADYLHNLGTDDGYIHTETLKEKIERLRNERNKRKKEKLHELINNWDPSKNEKATENPYKTLFVAHLTKNRETTEKSLKKEFERFGNITNLRIVKNKKGISRGYAFVEFEKERELKIAYRDAEGMRIDGYRIIVDVERGRTKASSSDPVKSSDHTRSPVRRRESRDERRRDSGRNYDRYRKY
ncbi:RNA-binding domain-containing protein [Rozella allomycis CSF55]|uniref:Nucleotide-binding, alpha-beta plait domain-containing protein n=1 Tax=Rozella allomycis (strain CSF55) TaxID=988480 RepID=A0A075AX27_ROZAC|nr:Nucleotide-binding, alpha-beta plait domain-containing protein [Rozella allomycis CSF55]RKP17877.1 RNA-binding domain-containing protein [Rozella allomycis CSF55]|eukprot:EPZ34885.1 Nucleotide-binding, alpha-beta plait domain-containing protein [Rozella allomycis CSF55]